MTGSYINGMPCIEWLGARNKAGYGVVRVGSKVRYLHRLAYERHVGPIPKGMELDHLCRNRACFRPHHLEAVTHAENMRRGKWGRVTHCPRNHPYVGDNLRINAANGGRECRTCVNARKRAAYHRRKGQP